jgi:hypothetical protein
MIRPAFAAAGMVLASAVIGLVMTYLFSHVLPLITHFVGLGHLALGMLVLLVALAQWMHTRQPPAGAPIRAAAS